MELRYANINDIAVRPDGFPDPSLIQKIQEGIFEREPERLTSLDGLKPEFPGLSGFVIDMTTPGKSTGRIAKDELDATKARILGAIGVMQGQIGSEGGLIIPEQGKKGAFYALNHPIERVFFDSDIDAVAYGSILMSNLGELRRFDAEAGRLRIAIAPQWAYETDDGSGLMSPDFAARMEIPQDRAFQFRLAGLFGEGAGRKGFVGKGTLRQALPGEAYPEGADMVLTMDNLKGRKLSFFEPYRIGEPLENGTLMVDIPVGVVGIREFSRNNPIGLGDTILKTVPAVVIDEEIRPRSERNLAAAERALATPRGLQELISGDFKPEKDPIAAAYRRRLFALQEMGDEHHLVARRTYFEAEPSLLERFVELTDENGVNPLFGHDVINREVVQSIGTIFRNAAEGSDVKFNSGMLFPLRALEGGECFVPGAKPGEEIIVFRQPINGLRSIQVLKNVGAEKAGNPDLESFKGVIFVYSNRPPADYERLRRDDPNHPTVTSFELGQKNRAGASWDFDGDFLGWSRAADFPMLARTVRAAHAIIDRGDDPTYFGREREREFANVPVEKRTPEMVAQFERRQRYRDLEMEDKYPKKAERAISNENMVELALANYENVVGQVTNLMNKFVDLAHERVIREQVIGENETGFYRTFEQMQERFFDEVEGQDHDPKTLRVFARQMASEGKRFADPEKVGSGAGRFEKDVYDAALALTNQRRVKGEPLDDGPYDEFSRKVLESVDKNLLPPRVNPKDIETYMHALVSTREFNIAQMLGAEVEKAVKFKKVCPINHQLIDRARSVLKDIEKGRLERHGAGPVERYANKYKENLFSGPGTELVNPTNAIDLSPLSDLARGVSVRYAALLERFETDVARPRRVFETLMPKAAPEEIERVGPVVKEISAVYRRAAIRASEVWHPDPREATERRKEIIGESLRGLRSFIETYPPADRLAMAGVLWGQMHGSKAAQRKLEVNLFFAEPAGEDQYAGEMRRLKPAPGELLFSRFEQTRSFRRDGGNRQFQERHHGVSVRMPEGALGGGVETERIFARLLAVVQESGFSHVVIRSETGRGPGDRQERGERLVRMLENRLTLNGIKAEPGGIDRYPGAISKAESGTGSEVLTQGEAPAVSNGRLVFNLFGKELFESFQQRERFPRKFTVTGVARNDFAEWGESEGWDGSAKNVQMFQVREEVVGGEGEGKGRREIRNVVDILSQDGEEQGRLGTISADGKAVPPGIYQGIFWRETEHRYDPVTRQMETKRAATLEISEAQLIALPLDHGEKSMRRAEAAEPRFPDRHVMAHLVPASGWDTVSGTAAKLAALNPEVMDAFVEDRRAKRYLKPGDMQTVVLEVDGREVIQTNIVAGFKSYDAETTTFEELRRGIRLGAMGLSRLVEEGGAGSVEVVIDARLAEHAGRIRQEFAESYSRGGSALPVEFMVDDANGPFIGDRAFQTRPIPRFGSNAFPPPEPSASAVAERAPGRAMVEFSRPESGELRGEVLFVLAAPLGMDEAVRTGPMGIVGERYPDVRETFGHWNSRLVPPRPGEVLVTRRDETSLVGIVVTGANVAEDARRAGLSAGTAGKTLGFREVRFLTDEAYPNTGRDLVDGFREGMAQSVSGDVKFSQIGIPKGRTFQPGQGALRAYQVIHGMGELAPPPERLLVVNLVGLGSEAGALARREKGFGAFLERNFPVVSTALRESGEGMFLGAVQTVNQRGKSFEASALVFANAAVFSSPGGRSIEAVRASEGQFSEVALNLAFLGRGGIFELLEREKGAGREMGLYVVPMGRELTAMKRERVQAKVEEYLNFGQTQKGGSIRVVEPWRSDVLQRMVSMKDSFQPAREVSGQNRPKAQEAPALAGNGIGR